MRTVAWRAPISSARVIVVLVVAVAVSVLSAAAARAQPPGDAVDCVGPVGEPEPGTPEWQQRDAENAYCAEQRHLDKLVHPLNLSPPDELGADAYREPSRHAGQRFRYDTTTIAGLDAEVYRPCAADSCTDQPEALATHEPPYPAVITFHGGASRKELHWWSSQTLAEAGYLVIAYDSAGVGPTVDEAATMMEWLHGDDPLVADFDGERVGLAGHSGGGVVVNAYGHSDPRVDAIVSWDRAQSTALPAEPPPTAPSLFLFADYNCQQVPFCQPDPYLDRPDPTGPGNKGQDFQVVRDAGVDTMQLGLRAAMHLDWVPSDLAGNRFAEVVTVYFTRAWMDRYVRGLTEPEVATAAFARLTARTFDDSADVLNISQGLYDPAAAVLAGDPYAGNVPYTIADLPVADRLSFYFLSKCSLTVPGSDVRATSDDLRSQPCVAPAVLEPEPSPPAESPSPPPATGALPVTGGGTAAAALMAMSVAAALRRRGRSGRRSGGARRRVATPLSVLAIGALMAVPAAAQEPDPCTGWQVRDLVSGLGLIENLEPDGRGGMLLSTERDRIERLLPDGTVEVAFEDVPAPGGLRVVDGVLFANSGNSLQAGVMGSTDGTIERIDLDTGARETWAEGLTMPNGLVIAADGRAFTSRDVGVDGAITMVPPDSPREPQRWAEIRDTNGLAIDAAQEWLYAATTFDPLAPVHRVRLDDPTVIELVANLTTVGVPIVKGLDDLTIDGADVLYVTANGSGEVLRLDPSTGDACVIASGLGNPTAVKLGAGPGWERDHLYVSAWDGIVRELVPPPGAAPTPLPSGSPGPNAPPPPQPVPGTSDGPSPQPDRGALPTTGGGAAAVALLALVATSVGRVRHR